MRKAIYLTIEVILAGFTALIFVFAGVLSYLSPWVPIVLLSVTVLLGGATVFVDQLRQMSEEDGSPW